MGRPTTMGKTKTGKKGKCVKLGGGPKRAGREKRGPRDKPKTNVRESDLLFRAKDLRPTWCGNRRSSKRQFNKRQKKEEKNQERGTPRQSLGPVGVNGLRGKFGLRLPQLRNTKGGRLDMQKETLGELAKHSGKGRPKAIGVKRPGSLDDKVGGITGFGYYVGWKPPRGTKGSISLRQIGKAIQCGGLKEGTIVFD